VWCAPLPQFNKVLMRDEKIHFGGTRRDTEDAGSDRRRHSTRTSSTPSAASRAGDSTFLRSGFFDFSLRLLSGSWSASRPVRLYRALVILQLELLLLDGLELIPEVELGSLLLQLSEFVLVLGHLLQGRFDAIHGNGTRASDEWRAVVP